jgi:NAD(P)-dependent dehydrogenase (short-subunit alcohol dehydrogenase family)
MEIGNPYEASGTPHGRRQKSAAVSEELLPSGTPVSSLPARGRPYAAPTTRSQERSMIDNPVALVTGANKGLGRETARQLGASGVTVLLGSRDLTRGEVAAAELAAEGIKVSPVQLDVTDVQSAERVADKIRQEFGLLDILVNNAGGIVETPALSATAADLRATYETNVFGVVTVTCTMLPLLAASRAARIVNVSSTSASLSVMSEPGTIYAAADYILPYASSKAALNMLTVQYAQAFAGTRDTDT